MIDNKQHYKFMGKDIDVISLIKLHLLEGKVVRHEDWYVLKPLTFFFVLHLSFGIFCSSLNLKTCFIFLMNTL